MKKRINTRKFRLHFNRVNMQRGNPHVWTIHLSNQCIPARAVYIYVPTQAVFEAEKKENPRAWIEGHGVIQPHESSPGVYIIESPRAAYTREAERKELS